MIKKYEKMIIDQGLPYNKMSSFIESLTQITNIKPDLFIVPYYKSLGLKCKEIPKYFGTAYFIRKSDIQDIVKECSIVKFG